MSIAKAIFITVMCLVIGLVESVYLYNVDDIKHAAKVESTSCRARQGRTWKDGNYWLFQPGKCYIP